jgi:hypothetical protein
LSSVRRTPDALVTFGHNMVTIPRLFFCARATASIESKWCYNEKFVMIVRSIGTLGYSPVGEDASVWSVLAHDR